RTDLPLHLANQVAHPQEVLLCVVQFPQGFPFLRLEFRDARRFLEDHPAILRFAGENLRDVPLSHDAVAAPPDPGAQEQFLDVLEAAWRAVDKVLAASVT